MNHRNTVVWAEENPYLTREHLRASPKVNVWAAVHSGGILGPYFFQEPTVNSRNYLQMLQNFVAEELPLNIVLNGYFQQDGVPPHYATIVRGFLDETFKDRWIGRAGPIQWPPHSPDLTPCDFWLWGMVKNRVYSSPVQSMEELKERIRQTISDIPVEMCARAVEATFDRFQTCIEHNGEQVEGLP
jgi:hypothetical protein